MNAETIHVLHVGPEAGGRGGVSASIQRLLESPLAARHEMQAVATWRHDAASVRRLVVFVVALARLAVWCLRPGRRVVHVQLACFGSWYRKAVVIVLARLLRRPVLLQLQVGPGEIVPMDERLDRARRALFRRAFAKASRVISVSRSGAAEMERRYELRDVVVVSNPLPQPVSAPSPLDGSPPVVLYVGGFQAAVKGGDLLIEALPEILAGGAVGRVVIAGPGELPDAARPLIAHPGVEWLGWLEGTAKSRAYAQASVFVLPSRSEGMPHALLEAMAHGHAIVATEVGGVPEVITHAVEGLLVPPENPRALADAVCAVTTDSDLRRRLGEAARKRAEGPARNRVWEQLDAIYHDLVAQ